MRLAPFSTLVLATVLFLFTISGCASVNRPSGFKLPFVAESEAESEVAEQPQALSNEQAQQLVGAKQSEVQPASATALWGQDSHDPLRKRQPLDVATDLASIVTGKADAAKGQQLFQEAENIFASASAADGQSRVSGFATAAEKYHAAGKAFPPSPQQENAYFMTAEAYFFSDQYPKAADAYANLVKHYPNTRHIDSLDERRFAIAKYWLDVHDRESDWWPNIGSRRRPAVNALGHSVKLFDKIRFDNPTGQIADDATMAAAIANLNNERFAEADVLLEDIRENFPNSQHQFRAHLLSLECKQKIYRGPDYDGTALDEAEKLIKQMHILFPRETSENKDYVQASLREIRLKKAELHFAEARYYDRRKEYGAARLAYTRVAEDFQDTNLAVEAESRLAQIGGKPDTPKNQLKWLADVFPKENTRPRPLLARDGAGVKIR